MLITRSQAAIFLTKMLYNPKMKDARDEAMKGGVLEQCIKNLTNPDSALSSLSMGIIPPLMTDEVTRAAVLDAKPSVLNSINQAINFGSSKACWNRTIPIWT